MTTMPTTTTATGERKFTLLPGARVKDSPQLTRVRDARAALLLTHPFFGVLSLKLDIIEASSLVELVMIRFTAGVTDKAMIFNPLFVDTLTDGELKGLIAHEVLHLALGHHARLGNRDPRKWNQACISVDTSILMADNTYKPAGSVMVGDLLWSPTGPSRVMEVLDKGLREVVRLSHADGECWATPDHRFLTEKGFSDAASQNSGVHWEVLRKARRGKVRSGELQNDVDAGNGRRHGGGLSQRRWALGAAQADGQPLHDETPDDRAGEENVFSRAGVFGGDNRWGGHADNSASVPERTHALSALCDHIQHLEFSPRLAGRAGLQHAPDNQQQRPSILASELERFRVERIPTAGSALSDYQETARLVDLGVHLDTAVAVEESAADGSYARNCLSLQMAERARVTIRRTGETRRVVDFVTTQHVFVAGDLLTHNCDHAINHLLIDDGFILPDGGLMDPQFKGMSAETIYPLLPDPPQQPQQGQGGSGGSEQGDPTGGEGGNQPDKTPGAWGQFQSPGPEGSSENESSAREWAENAAEAAKAAQSAGKLPAHIKRIVDEMLAPKADWKSLFRRFMTDQVKQVTTWAKPNKRFFPRTYLPGVKREGMGEVVFIIDTSGSIGPEQLGIFQAVANDIIQTVSPAAVHVVYADADVNRVDSYEVGEDIELEPVGGGGTDFRPAFERIAEEGWTPACACYLTDLMGSFPDTEMTYPVLWISYGGGDAVAPWGETVKMDG